MTHVDEMIKFKDEQEKLLKDIILKLELERESLDQNQKHDIQKIEDVNTKLVDAYTLLSQVQEEKANLKGELSKRDVHENLIEPLKDLSEKVSEFVTLIANREMAAGIVKILDQSGQALDLQNPNDIMMREFAAQNQIVIEQHIDSRQAVVTNPSHDTNSVQDSLKDEFEKINDGIKDAFEASGGTQIPEMAKTSAELKWAKDIDTKEQNLRDGHQKQLDALEKNNARLEIQKNDAKKFPDAEKKLERLKPMDELIKKEEGKIDNKFKNSEKELNKEKETLQQAVESAKQIDGHENQQAFIQQRRDEFERQRELERIRQLDEQNRIR